MAKSVHITTPIPTPDELAQELGIPPKRRDEIRRIVEETYAEMRRERLQKSPEARLRVHATEAA